MVCVEPDSDEIVPKEELYSKYIDYCMENKLPAKSSNVFGRDIRVVVKSIHNIWIKEERPKIGSNRVRCWKGIRLVENSDSNTPVGNCLKFEELEVYDKGLDSHLY